MTHGGSGHKRRHEVFLAEMLADEMQCREIAGKYGDAACVALRANQGRCGGGKHEYHTWTIYDDCAEVARSHAMLAWSYARRALELQNQLEAYEKEEKAHEAKSPCGDSKCQNLYCILFS